MKVIGDAGNARDAIFEVRAGKPDVVLLDVVMPDESGIEALPKLLHEAPDGQGADALDAGRPELRARGVRRRRERLRPEGGGRRGGGGSDPRGGGRQALRASRARREDGRRRRCGTGGCCLRPALGPRARGAAAPCARPHEPGDRQAALHLGANRRDPPGAHHAQAPALDPRRARSLRDRARTARASG